MDETFVNRDKFRVASDFIYKPNKIQPDETTDLNIDPERIERAKEITNDIHDIIDDNIDDIDMMIDVFVAALSATIDRRSSRIEDTVDCIDFLCKNLYKDR